MGNWRERAKNFGRRAQETVDRGIDRYNETIDKIKTPEVGVGLSQQTMIYIGVAILAIWFLFKRK